MTPRESPRPDPYPSHQQNMSIGGALAGHRGLQRRPWGKNPGFLRVLGAKLGGVAFFFLF